MGQSSGGKQQRLAAVDAAAVAAVAAAAAAGRSVSGQPRSLKLETIKKRERVNGSTMDRRLKVALVPPQHTTFPESHNS